MKNFRTPYPEAQFDIPPSAPLDVVSAHATFEPVADEWEAARSSVTEIAEQARAAVGEAHRASAQARVAGSAPPKQTPDKVEALYERKLVAARSEIAVLADALDSAGDSLAHAIAENREQWLVDLDETEREATAKLSQALADARDAIDVLGSARSAPTWLRDFNVNLALRGEQDGFGAGTLTVDVPRNIALDTYTPPERILGLLDVLVTPPEPRKPRTLKRARASSMA